MYLNPTFRMHTDPETGQTTISGMGELHLDIIVEDVYKRQVNTSKSISANSTYYPITKLNTYTVSYNANGGSGAPARDVYKRQV